jgi:lipopolysaccharide assembly protein B
MHQNLLERGDLGQEQRLAAMFELGQDYLKAGLLDRAEKVFVKLRDTPHRNAALKALLDIYQQEKEWEKTIGVARELAADSGQTWAKEIANYYCELALVDMTHSRSDAALARLEEALVTNRKCARAYVLLGDIHAAAGNHEAAVEAWKRIEQQNPPYLALVARRLLESYRSLGRPEEGLILLRGYLASSPSLDLLDVVFQSTLEAQGPQAAHKLVQDELRRNQTLLGLDRLLDAELLVVRPERRDDVQLVKNLVHSHARRLARYSCENCGFKARQFYWHCPACQAWGSYSPRRGEETGMPL